MSVIHEYSAHVAEFKRIFDTNYNGTRGANRSVTGDNVTLSYGVSNGTQLNRTISATITDKETVINASKRDQSFSLSRKSMRVALDYVDPEMAKANSRSATKKLAKAQELKRQNNLAPMSAMQRIDRKLNDLFRKLAKSKRFGLDTKILDALILLSNYHKHREQVRLAELAARGEAKDIEMAAILLPSSEVPVFEKPVVPASFGRTYKVKRRIIKDRIIRHGSADVGHIAIKPRSNRKPRNTDKAKALRLELKRIANKRNEAI